MEDGSVGKGDALEMALTMLFTETSVVSFMWVPCPWRQGKLFEKKLARRHGAA